MGSHNAANLVMLQIVDSIPEYKSIVVQMNVGSPRMMFADVVMSIGCISHCSAHKNIAGDLFLLVVLNEETDDDSRKAAAEGVVAELSSSRD
jgi:hypothetical protein